MSVKAFKANVTSRMWEVHGAEVYSNVTYVAGANHSTSPYAMKEAAALCSFLLHKRNILATRAAVLYHENPIE